MSCASPQDEALQSVSEKEWMYERRQAELHLTGEDVNLQLCHCDDQMHAALATKNAELIGRMVMAVRETYLDKLADQACDSPSKRPEVEEAAQAVIDAYRAEAMLSPRRFIANEADVLAGALRKAAPRRFTGESPTDFGALYMGNAS